VRRPVAASLTAATASRALMISRPMHSRVIMPAAITGRDSTARYSAMRGPKAAWRALAQGGPHQEAMAISLSGETVGRNSVSVLRRKAVKLAEYAIAVPRYGLNRFTAFHHMKLDPGGGRTRG
jgi:hypothetical protein